MLHEWGRGQQCCMRGEGSVMLHEGGGVSDAA